MAIDSISAQQTDLARRLEARFLTDGVIVGDWSFQVGSYGFDLITNTLALPVDPTLQALVAPVGGLRPLGREVVSGAAATVTVLTGGFVEVTGLVGLPSSVALRWLQISGSADTNINGTWVISEATSTTSVIVEAPLVAANDAGPLSWSFREACVPRPNARARDFHGRLLDPDATVDDTLLGEVGIFGRVLRAPADPALLGLQVLWCTSHMPAVGKIAGMTANYHICVQS